MQPYVLLSDYVPCSVWIVSINHWRDPNCTFKEGFIYFNICFRLQTYFLFFYATTQFEEQKRCILFYFPPSFETLFFRRTVCCAIIRFGHMLQHKVFAYNVMSLSLSCGHYCASAHIGSYILKSMTLLSSYVAILLIWIKSSDFSSELFTQCCASCIQ